jgi:predicted phosphoadenosine phosphosulfate sulfurtransferase
MRKEVFDYIKTWEKRCYSEGLPDEVPNEINALAPSYKNIVKAILRNEVKILGILRPACKSYVELKRIEISKRPGFKPDSQLKLF